FRAGNSFVSGDFPGVLDEIRVSNTAHSAAQVSSNFIGYDGPVVTLAAPAIIQSGAAPAPFTLYGNGLYGCTVTANQAGVSVSNATPSDTQVQLSVAVDVSVPVGPISFTVTDLFARTTTAQITVVNQRAFPNSDSGTVLVWHLDETG